MREYLYGVSPAYMLSVFGEGFSPDDVISVLDGIKELGFDEFQCELVSDTKLPLWEEGGAVRVAAAAKEKGLKISQMVAHFMLEYFKDEATLFSDSGIDEIKRLLAVMDLMDYRGQLTLPMGAYKELSALDDAGKARARARLGEKVGLISRLAEEQGSYIALEVQPGALICGGAEILAFARSVGENVMYNYDTGHAWASGDKTVADFPGLFGRRLTGTHLCDNDGITNLSLAPDKGTIDWDKLVGNLVKSGYSGGLDLEIFTTAEKVKGEYTAAFAKLKARVESSR